ncbi:MAG: GxxExxY protein [Candidatus Margulisiibacteriota bacterium]|nr:GxxExxY protein [Candidatus Margulisiibacteriota bacterium]
MKNYHQDTKAQRDTKNFEPISLREELIAKEIVNAAYKVHKNLGPGLLESVYEVCFCHELNKAGLITKRQIYMPIVMCFK